MAGDSLAAFLGGSAGGPAGAGSASRWTRCRASLVSPGARPATRETSWPAGVRMISARRSGPRDDLPGGPFGVHRDQRQAGAEANQVNSFPACPVKRACRWEPVRISPGTTVVTVTGPRPSSARSPSEKPTAANLAVL